ncbi:MAG: hypothetical protein HY682_00740 [Chloroflexi bacterium]|nr:hypothetical protein [Chloroflexota bacterium]
MSLARLTATAIAVAFAVALVAVACGGPTSTQLVQTVTTGQKIENATATAKALIEKGLDPSNPQVIVGAGSLAEQFQQTAVAGLTATAQAVAAGGGTPAAGTSEGDSLPKDPPAGDPLSGTVTVKIENRGLFNPQVIKIKVGTTVVWENTERTAHSSVSDPGQAEEWNSGTMSRRVGQTENVKFEYQFTKPGRYTYGSREGGENSLGVVFVME